MGFHSVYLQGSLFIHQKLFSEVWRCSQIKKHFSFTKLLFPLQEPEPLSLRWEGRQERKPRLSSATWLSRKRNTIHKQVTAPSRDPSWICGQAMASVDIDTYCLCIQCLSGFQPDNNNKNSNIYCVFSFYVPGNPSPSNVLKRSSMPMVFNLADPLKSPREFYFKTKYQCHTPDQPNLTLWGQIQASVECKPPQTVPGCSQDTKSKETGLF